MCHFVRAVRVIYPIGCSVSTTLPLTFRCASLTCSICSRTCTTPPPSQPPTPHLTYSPTPTPTPPLPPTSLPLPSSSPRRTALGLASLNISNTNSGDLLGVNSLGAGRRRKFKDEEWKLDELGLKGCGRVLCKGCCEESWQRSVWFFVLFWLFASRKC